MKKNVRKNKSGATKRTPSKNQAKIVTAPVTAGAVIRTNNAKVNGGKGFRVTHSEIIFPITSVAYNGQTTFCKGINPTSVTMFPWLCSIAERFEKYRFHSLRYDYTPVCPTTTQGTFCMALDYDPDDFQAPSIDDDGRREIMSHQGAVQGPVWAAFSLAVPSNQLSAVGERWVRNWEIEVDPLPEARTSDLGNLLGGLFGTNPTAIAESSQWFGDLRVTYDVELSLPQLHNPVQETGSQLIKLAATDEESNLYDDVDNNQAYGLKFTDPLTEANLTSQTQYVTYDSTGNPLLSIQYGTGSASASQLPTGNTLKVEKDFSGRIEFRMLQAPRSESVDPETTGWDFYYGNATGASTEWGTPIVAWNRLSDALGDPGTSLYTNYRKVPTVNTYFGELPSSKVLISDTLAGIRHYVVELVGTFVKNTFLRLFKRSAVSGLTTLATEIFAEPRSLTKLSGLLGKQRITHRIYDPYLTYCRRLGLDPNRTEEQDKPTKEDPLIATQKARGPPPSKRW
jgi:hypothetical protein